MAENDTLSPKQGKNRGNAGMGRPKGSPNKATKAFRDTVTKLLEDNADNVSVWLTAVAQDDPAKALDLMSKLAEYATPKLARTDNTHSGVDGGPIQHAVKVKFGD